MSVLMRVTVAFIFMSLVVVISIFVVLVVILVIFRVLATVSPFMATIVNAAQILELLFVRIAVGVIMI